MDARIKPKAAGPSARVLLLRWINRVRLTQAEAADHIGISRVKLNQYLNGERGPSLATAIRIEDATGIAMRSWLIEDAEPAGMAVAG
jgi:transcriptional regulator with XRE-family HTH domain